MCIRDRYNDDEVLTTDIFNLDAGVDNVVGTYDDYSFASAPHQAEITVIDDDTGDFATLIVDIIVGGVVMGLGDQNTDGVVNVFDMVLISVNFGKIDTDVDWVPEADTNGDGVINIQDFMVIGENWGNVYTY